MQNDPSPARTKLSRRHFVGAAALTVLPRHVLGGAGFTAASDTLNVAGVGVGGKGFSDLDAVKSENIVAICDVDWRLARRAFKRWPQAKRYKDYRVMLDKQKDIDAVMVATADHTHASISMAAIRRGKHVYCQKPLTHTVHEARALAEAARKHKVATQMGNQGQASEETRRICELIGAGAIGPVREVHVWTDRPLRGLLRVYWPQGVDRPQDRPPVPKDLDWDLFLGPAPERPYHPAYTPFKWRGWWDFGTGALGDIGCHRLDAVFRALKLGHPLSFQACSSLVNRETYPVASIVQYDFPARGEMPPVKVAWYDGGMKPPRPEGIPDGVPMGTNGCLYVGDEGMILDNRIYPETRRREFADTPRTLPRSPGHYEEWLIHAKEGTPAGSNFDWAGPLTEVVLLGNIALRTELKEQVTRQRLAWDPKAFAITNLPEANKYLRCVYRKGWTL
jgi:predicted dehydrogenase